MLFKVLAVAGWAAVAVVSAASAQSISGPAEMPPAGFKGSQYVDSRGCVFLRAGIGGRTNWVPRVSRNRKALCGQSPASAARDVAKVEPVARPAPTPAPRVASRPAKAVGRPMETVASQHRRPNATRVAPVTVPQPKVAAVATPRAAAGAVMRQNACPASSPFGARVTLSDGRRTLLCSADANFDVTAAASRVQVGRAANADAGYAPKVAPVGDGYSPKATSSRAGYRCPAEAPVAQRYQIQGGGTTVMCTAASRLIDTATPPLVVPQGYKLAWDDDRLNPNRGPRTARGQAQQDQIWTRDVPAQLIINAPATPRKTYATSTSSGSLKAAGAGYYVQVGTFGEPANAQRSVARLQGLGLPVAKSRISSKGRSMQVVMAGPFRDAGAAQAALSKARRSGFGDAFIR